MFGWPLEQAATRSAFVGEGAGMLEVVEIPSTLRGTVAPGVRLLAVANRDAEGAAARRAPPASTCGDRWRSRARGSTARRSSRSRGRRALRADPVRLTPALSART